jgi:hypothetical protein
MEFEARPKPKRCALGVLGKFEMLGQRQVVVKLLAEVFDQPILHHAKEIIRRRSSVMLQRVEPTRRDVGVPRQHHASARNFGPSRVSASCQP